MRLAEEEARLKAEEEARREAAEAKRVSDEQAAMAALFEEAEATKKLLAEEKATTAALKAAVEREHVRAALLEEMETAEKRLAKEKACRAEEKARLKTEEKLSIAFKKWQATVAQTNAEVEVELQKAMQKAVWPCGGVLVHEEDKLRAAEWERRNTVEPWLHRMTKETCIQTSGGTPPVSGKPRRSPWFLLFSCIALVCCVVLMVMLMPVMSEDAHVEKPKNFQDIERASPQDIEEAMNQLKEETRAAEAIKDQKARKKARILKEDNERAAKLGPILQKQKQEYAKKKRAVDAEKKLLERHAKTTEEVDANVEQHFSEIDNKAAKAKESKIKTAEKIAKTAVLDLNELKAKNATKEAKVKKAARERVAKEKLAKKTAETAVLDPNELRAKNAAKEAKVKKAAKEAKFKMAADERRQKTQKLLPDGYECCDLPQHATPEQRAATKEALQKKQEKEEEKANLALQKTFCWGVSLPLAAAYPPFGVPAVATCANFAYSH